MRSRGVAENEQEHKPHPRRSLLAQLDDEAHSTAKIPVEPSHFTSPSGGSQTTELKPISEPGSPVTEPQSLEVKPTDTQSLSTKPTDSTEPSDAKPAKSCAKPTDADGTKPADTTESQSKPTESQTVTVTPAVLGPQPVIPEPQNTPEEKPTAKQDAITPTTRGGVKLPPGAVPVFSLVSPSVTPITVKLPPGAVPVFSATPAKPAKPSTASGGVKLPPGAVSVIPPAITAPSQQLVKDANQSTTWKEAPPPVHPKPKSFTKREHTSANPSSLAPSFKTPSNAVQVLPIQQAPPAKRRKGSHDDREQGTVKSKGQPEASVPVSNGIHANGVLTNGTELVNGELETPISFDQVCVSKSSRTLGPKPE